MSTNMIKTFPSFISSFQESVHPAPQGNIFLAATTTRTAAREEPDQDPHINHGTKTITEQREETDTDFARTQSWSILPRTNTYLY
jgi:hypothetical protein